MGGMQHQLLCQKLSITQLMQGLVAAAAPAVAAAVWQLRGTLSPAEQRRSSTLWRHRSSSTGRRRRRSSPTRSAPGTRSMLEGHWTSPA